MLTRLTFCAVLLFMAFGASSSPWINPDDKFLHSSLQVLQKSGKVRLPLGSYPLSWVSVIQQLNQLDRNQLNEVEQLAVLRLMTAADFARQDHIRTIILSGSTEPVGSGLQGARFDESGLLAVMSEHKGHNWAIGLRSNFRVDARDDKKQHFDGSYLAYTFSNWIVSLSQQPLWLGNSHTQGEQLSWQGRAPKTVQLSRLNPSLSLLSDQISNTPVAMRLILGEMPGSTELRDARFAIATVNTMPIAKTELGVSYATLRDLPEAENTLVPAAEKNSLSEVQLDLRYYLGKAGLYGQWVRQDNNAKNTNHFSIGTDWHTWLNGWQSTFFIEYRHFEQAFINWRQPVTFQQSPLIEPLPIKTNKVAGAQFYQASGIGFNVKINQLSYSAADYRDSHMLYHLGGQYPMWNGLVTAELQHSAKTTDGISSRWQGAVRYEYRW